MGKIMLSIVVPTYNHEKYIIQALESIRMQKTKYSYEVLIGEDCSTDNTRAILKEYEKEHPGFATFFYRAHNMNNEKIRNARDLRERCGGKYIVILEGDDYWIDEYKIEKQIDFLESHPDYIAVSHKCEVIDENNNPKDEKFPSCKEDNYTLNHYASEIMPGQTTTVMFRNILKMKNIDLSFYNENIQPGDRRLFFTLVSYGKIYCMPDIMSAYRHVTSGGSSFSATSKYSFERNLLWYKKQLEYSYTINNKESIRVAEMMFVAEVRKIMFRKLITINRALKELSFVKNRNRALLLIVKRDFNRFLLKKEIVI